MRAVLAFLLLFPGVARADPLGDALARLRTAPDGERDAAVRAVLDLEASPDEVVKRLAGALPVAWLEPGWHVRTARDAEGVERPFQLYVPDPRPDRAVPLLVHLHGGVARPAFLTEPQQVGYGRLWTASADRAGFAVAFPLGREDCTWWSAAGVRHVRAVVREAKRLLPVDDDAIVATGFSDGGSGCYHLAMAAPDPFGAFLAMNGHPAVAASASGEQLYLRNLASTPLFATMTRDDALYPAATVLEHLLPMLERGAPIRIASWESGNHRPVYFEDLRATFEGYLLGTARDPLPREIEWRCATPALGRVRWVEILAIGPGPGDADAEEDLNVVSRPSRVRLGINVDRAFDGPGVLVSGVAGDTPAEAMGLEEGDVVTALDGRAVQALPDLVAVLGEKTYGDAVTVTVKRGDATRTLEGAFPAFEPRPYYRRDQPTARLSLRVEGATIRITSRNVRRVRLLLAPSLVDGDPAVVVNGRPVAVEPRALPLEEIVRRYAREADAGRVFTREIVLALPAAEER